MQPRTCRPRPIRTRKRGLEPAHCVSTPRQHKMHAHIDDDHHVVSLYEQCVSHYLAIKNNFRITHNIICRRSTTQPCQAYLLMRWLGYMRFYNAFSRFNAYMYVRILPAPQKRNKSGRLTFLYEFFSLCR